MTRMFDNLNNYTELNGKSKVFKAEVLVGTEKYLTHRIQGKVGYVKGAKRKILKKKLENIEPHKLRTKMALNMNKSLAKKGKYTIPNKSVLKKIRSESKRALNRDDDDFTDLVKMAEEHPEYIKYISRVPFSVIVYDERIYKLMKRNNISKIAYLDGTGSIVKFKSSKQKVQVYVLLGHNFLTNHRFAISTLITESHSTLDFHKWR